MELVDTISVVVGSQGCVDVDSVGFRFEVLVDDPVHCHSPFVGMFEAESSI